MNTPEGAGSGGDGSEGFPPVHSHGSRPYDWVGAWSEKRAELSPDRIGLVDDTTGREFTYAELDARANRTARLFRAHGVADGERVAVVSRNRPALVDLFFACGKTGGVLAPLSHRLAARELGDLLANVAPELLVVEEPYQDAVATALEDSGVETTVRSLPADETDGTDDTYPSLVAERPDDDSPVDAAELSMDDPAMFLHTGGSTGTPKETVLSHGGLLWNSVNTITAWGLRDDDTTPMVFPMFHTGGWNVLTLPLFHMGGTVVIAREFDPGEVLDLVERTSSTVLVAVPAVLRMMTEHDDWADTDLSTLRFAKSGGGPCRDAVLRRWWDRGVDLSQGYGLTECGPNNFTMPDGWPREKADSVGVPAMHVDAADVDVVLFHGSEYKDHYVWSAAADIADRLGAENAYASESYALCAGQPLAFRQVAAQLATGDIDTALLVGASREEELVDYTDADASFMFNFGSGACATVLERGGGERARATLSGHAARTDGSFSRDVVMPAGGSERPPSEETVREGLHALTVPDPDGMKERLAEVSLANFLGVADDALGEAGLTRADVDFVALTHMKRSFHEHLVGELGVGDGHQYLDQYGHVQSVDQVLALDEGLDRGLVDDGDVVLFLAAGTGYTWAASVLRWVD